jgi:hypothetical protein
MALGEYWKRVGWRGRCALAVAVVCVLGLIWWMLAGRTFAVGSKWVTVPVVFPTRGELIDGKRYLTREQTLGLALGWAFFEGDCGERGGADGRALEPLRFLHPKHLDELRRMGSSPLFGDGLIRMLGEIGGEPEVRLMDAALEKYRGRDLKEDRIGNDRIDAYQQAVIQLAKRDVPGARQLLEKLMDPAWWKEMDITYGGRQAEDGVKWFGANPAAEAQSMRIMSAREGVEWVEMLPEWKSTPDAAAHREEPGPPRYLEELEGQYRLHQGDVERALSGAWDYEKGLLSTVPGRARE